MNLVFNMPKVSCALLRTTWSHEARKKHKTVVRQSGKIRVKLLYYIKFTRNHYPYEIYIYMKENCSLPKA